MIREQIPLRFLPSLPPSGAPTPDGKIFVPESVRAGGDFKCAPSDPVHQAVGVVDAAAPEAGEVSFQRLWLADAVEVSPLDVLQQCVDALNHLPVLCLPIEIVGPAPFGE